MNSRLLLAVVAALSVFSPHGFCVGVPLPTVAISYDTTMQEVTVSWPTQPGYFYFLLTTADLVDDPWAYFDYAAKGGSGSAGRIIAASSPKLFFRVELTNDLNHPVVAFDHDGDMVSTVDELLGGTDPFSSLSLDADTIPDDWEVFHGLDITLGVDSSGDDAEPDGATTLTEYALNLDPSLRDHPDLSLQVF